MPLSCATCIYCIGADYGPTCRRYAPSNIQGLGRQGPAIWPTVLLTDWCGEFATAAGGTGGGGTTNPSGSTRETPYAGGS